MRAMWVVFIKEFQDIVRDRRRFIMMLVGSFIIFPLLFVGPYALILARITRQTTNVLIVPVDGAQYAPALIKYLSDEQGIQTISADNVEELVRSKKYAVGLIIAPDYEERLASGRTAQLIIVADFRRQVDLTNSRLGLALASYSDLLAAQRLNEHGLTMDLVKPLAVDQQNAATTEETAGSLIGLFIPGFIISIGLSSGMPVAVSAVAGEKKKQTLEPVLFTTVSRLQLVLAKLAAVLVSVLLNLVMLTLSVTLSAVILILVIARSIPDQLPAALETAESSSGSSGISEMLAGGYTVSPLAIILFLIAPALIVTLGAALQILISTWARNDEEAYTLLTPLSFFSGLVVLVAFFLDEYTPQLWHYALPVFGAIVSMRDLLSNHVDPASLTVMFVSSALYAALMIGLAVWMFHREEVVFRT